MFYKLAHTLKVTKGNIVGQIGENFAVEWLVKHSFKVLKTNFRRQKIGEIDIITEKSGVIHFIEVKTSKYYPNSAFAPEIRVNRRKIGALKRICETYLRETHVSQDRHWQIDVISVILDESGGVKEATYFPNAVFERKY